MGSQKFDSAIPLTVLNGKATARHAPAPVVDRARAPAHAPPPQPVLPIEGDAWRAAEVHLMLASEPPLALDVVYSRLFRLDAVELAILRLPAPITPASIESALGAQFDRVALDAATSHLVERGLLLRYDAPVRGPLERGPLTRLELGVAEDCNLRCPYCFVSQGSFGGQRRVMPLPFAQRAVDLLFAESQGAPLLQIGFYGGEPLLNIPVVKAIVEQATARGAETGQQVRFDLITNGTRLTPELAQFFRDYCVAIQISLDGPAEKNDELRPRVGGQGSHKAAIAPIKWLEDYPRLQGRATLTRANPEVDTIVDHLMDVGFNTVVARPVVGAEGGLGLDEVAAKRIVAGYRTLAETVLAQSTDAEATRRAAPFLGYFVKLLQGMPRQVPCQQGAWAVAAAADGQLYPCKDMAAKPEYAIGTVWTGIDWVKAYNDQSGKLLCQQQAPKKAECATCWGRELCQISCMHVCLEPKAGQSGEAEYSGHECDTQLGILEVSLNLFEALRQRRPAVFWKLLQVATSNSLPPPAALAG